MLGPEEQQVEICLLKFDLEEIQKELIAHHSAMPALDAEHEQKYREAITSVQVLRSLNAEIDRLQHDTVMLSAKREQQKRHFDEIARSVERAQESRAKFVEVLEREKQDTEQKICQYEDTMQEIADRFRRTHNYYNEDCMNAELEKVNASNADLGVELEKRQSVVDELKLELHNLEPDVPANLLAIVGKSHLEERVKGLTEQERALTEKLNTLKNK